MKKLHFGCGKIIKEGFVNVDVQVAKGIDKSFNFEEFPYPFEDNTFDYIFSENVMEHLINLDGVMNELHRISKHNGVIHIKVPYWNNTVAYNDYDHKHYFNERALEILFKTKTNYNNSEKWMFEIEEMNHISGRLKSKIPKVILFFLDKFLHGMFIELEVKSRVIK